MASTPGIAEAWSLVVTGGPPRVSRDFHPLADEWHDIAQRERMCGIVPGQPVLIAPGFIDYRLGDYFRTAFRADQSSTAKTYAVELRTWFNFLLARDAVRWDEADHRDVRAFQVWRVYDESNPRRVGAATWNKGWDALNHFYTWAKREGWAADNPVRGEHRLKNHDEAAAHREKNARVSRDRWLTPLEYVLWRDVGFRGYEAVRDGSGNLVPGLPSPRARSRNTARNVAFADYGLTTGLRRAEQGSLLCFEIPSAVDEEVPLIGKGMRFRHYRVVHRLGLESLSDYTRGERRDAVRRGRKLGRYPPRPDRLVAEIVHGRRGQRARLADGRVLDVPSLSAEERSQLLLDGPDGPEPAWLWLSDSGKPIDPESWGDVFEAGNRRVTTARAGHGVHSPWVTVTPHSLRFTFALFALLAAVRAIDDELGLSAADPFHFRNYSQAFEDVRDLLGHRSSLTTRNYYLEPVKGLRASRFLRGTTLSEMWDALREASPLIGFGGDR